MAFDLCGYEDSTCSRQQSPADQVDAVAAYLRAEGVRRVVAVGVSMGGSQTVRAVAEDAGVEAWVDVSGPSAWEGEDLLDVAPDVDSPGLVVQARSDGDAEYALAQQLAEATDSRFLDGGSGHGWDLVTDGSGGLSDVGRQILDFATSS